MAKRRPGVSRSEIDSMRRGNMFRARLKVKELVNFGYRLNPKAKTSQVYRDQVSKATAAGLKPRKWR